METTKDCPKCNNTMGIRCPKCYECGYSYLNNFDVPETQTDVSEAVSVEEADNLKKELQIICNNETRNGNRIDKIIKLFGKYNEPTITALQKENEEMREALEAIANWELPVTGKFWDREEQQPVSYEVEHGSNGVRDYIRSIASEALSKLKKQ